MDFLPAIEKYIPKKFKYVIPHLAINSAYNYVAIYLFSRVFFIEAPMEVSLAIAVLSGIFVTILLETIAVWALGIVDIILNIKINARLVAVCYGTLIFVSRFHKHYFSLSQDESMDSFIQYIWLVCFSCMKHACVWFSLYLAALFVLFVYKKIEK